ncbi:hypothetical protein FNU76_13270 [Chitinimonas arctica]|uniref:Uncharacterized protein n=1 Tax=Chitinimonas arctica TaxID=2594795 RepID=A0A516SGG9_9NEIS|nr:hypothetical protein [Chitinimonas arctica]QDQ27254.1 hypothetical protein FNU76_13270 [Chitinimonas arctica]
MTAIADMISTSGKGLARLLGLAAAEQIMPRRRCHLAVVPLRGVPRKHFESAILLRLQQFGLFDEIGFAYRVSGEQAQVWYWNDQEARQLFPTGRVQAWPEPLWRKPLNSGIRLLSCTEGYELEGVNELGGYRSRWFAHRPDATERLAFCRDLGMEPNPALENPVTVARGNSPEAGWRIHSRLAQPIPAWAWGAGAFVLIVGCIATLQFTQLAKLESNIQATEQEARALRKLTASAKALDAAISQLQPITEAMHEYSKAPRQIHWLAELARRDIVGARADVYLSEWIYRGDSVTATLRLGAKAKGADVLASLEQSALFADVALLPDPPAGALRVQLRLPEEATTPAAAPREQP